MLPHLLFTRRFLPIFVCQFFSALNDNFIKNALVILILYKLGSEQGGLLVTLAGAVLIIPFFFLSALGGELADNLADRIEGHVDGLVGVLVGGCDRHPGNHVLQRHSERFGVARRLPRLGPVVLEHPARLARE